MFYNLSKVPAPATIIASFIHPSHVVVQRCTGKIPRFEWFQSRPRLLTLAGMIEQRDNQQI
jgi:hypothetical protein